MNAALLRCCLVLVPVVVSAPAHAGELFGGVYAHGVNTPLTRDIGERGADLQVGFRLDPVLRLGPWAAVQPYAFASANTRGDTALGAAGLALKLGGALYVRPGLGVAVQSGPSRRIGPDGVRTDLGSRVLFEPELGIGMQLAPRVSVEASWVHVSHAQIFGRQNPGLDMIGARINLHLP